MQKNKKSIAALIGIALLLLLYLTTLITAFLNIPYWDRLFQASLIATVGIPILLWVYLLLFTKLRKQEQPELNDRENTETK